MTRWGAAPQVALAKDRGTRGSSQDSRGETAVSSGMLGVSAPVPAATGPRLCPAGLDPRAWAAAEARREPAWPGK